MKKRETASALPPVLRWTWQGRAVVFFLSASSIWCLLAEFYGLCSMRAFSGYVLLPATAMLAFMAVLDLGKGDGRLWRAVIIGAAGGLLAACAYDVFRLPFVVAAADKIGPSWMRLPLFKVFPRFGAMLLGQSFTAGQTDSQFPLLTHVDLKGQVALARPTAATTGGQVAALYVLWGDDRAKAFFTGLRANGVSLLGGNSVVAESIARGQPWVGVCDNDDAADAAANVGKLDATLPDQNDGEDGTLAIPCAVGLVAGGPNPQGAKRLIDFLLSRETGQKLIDAKFAWCATRDAAGKGRFMNVDYRAVAKAMPAAIRSATVIMEGR